MKTTSQSVLVSKLATHRRQNRTKKALWEFEHIIRSLYLLDYVDEASLRRNVHRALNRGEAYHRMRKAIAYAHGGRFRVHSQQEQELWNECARLLANAVVHYNGMLLSAVLKELEKKGSKRAIEVLFETSCNCSRWPRSTIKRVYGWRPWARAGSRAYLAGRPIF